MPEPLLYTPEMEESRRSVACYRQRWGGGGSAASDGDSAGGPTRLGGTPALLDAGGWGSSVGGSAATAAVGVTGRARASDATTDGDGGCVAGPTRVGVRCVRAAAEEEDAGNATSATTCPSAGSGRCTCRYASDACPAVAHQTHAHTHTHTHTHANTRTHTPTHAHRYDPILRANGAALLVNGAASAANSAAPLLLSAAAAAAALRRFAF